MHSPRMTTTTTPAAILAKAGVTNPTAAYHGERHPCISFQKAGDNYHVWLDPDTLQIPPPRENVLTHKLEKTELFRNPPTTIARGEPGHFDTQHLDARAKKWLPIAEAVLASVDLAAAKAAYDEKIAAEEAERDRQIALKLTVADAESLERVAGEIESVLAQSAGAATLRLVAEKIRNRFRLELAS